MVNDCDIAANYWKYVGLDCTFSITNITYKCSNYVTHIWSNNCSYFNFYRTNSTQNLQVYQVNHLHYQQIHLQILQHIFLLKHQLILRKYHQQQYLQIILLLHLQCLQLLNLRLQQNVHRMHNYSTDYFTIYGTNTT